MEATINGTNHANGMERAATTANEGAAMATATAHGQQSTNRNLVKWNFEEAWLPL
jgi:hypothetical protein